MSTFYNEYGKKIKIDDINTTYIGHGDFGEVRLLSNGKCIKYHRSNMVNETPSVMYRLKSIDSPNLYKIHNVLFSNFILTNNNYVGYTMDYYKPDNVDILTMPVDYTITNLLGLYKLMIEVGKKGVILCDTHERNLIMTNNNIVIIDCDNSTINSYNHKRAIIENLNIPTCLLINLFKGSIVLNHKKVKGLDQSQVDYLFGYNIPNEEGKIARIIKLLSKYDYPIDALRSFGNKISFMEYINENKKHR